MIKPEAVLFDLDGVLCDTSEYHFLAWKRLADELGLRFIRMDNERLKGVSRLRSFEIILEINGRQAAYSENEKNRLANRKNAYYKDLIEQMAPANILPGVQQFLYACRHARLNLAVASASKNAQRVLERIGLSDAFDYVADAAQIKCAKPDPEVFLDCAHALRVRPERCIGIEDAQAGIPGDPCSRHVFGGDWCAGNQSCSGSVVAVHTGTKACNSTGHIFGQKKEK